MLCTLFFSLFPFRHIVKDAAFFQLFVFRQFLQHDLIELGGLIVVEHHNAEKLIEPQEFIGLEEVSLGVASRLGIGAGGTVDGRKQRCQGKLIVGDGDRDLAALFSKVFRAGHIVAAHVKGHVKGAELIFPFLPRIFFLPLGERLHRHLHGHIKAADGVEYIRDAFHIADVEIFFQAEVCQYGKPPAMETGVIGELREGQGEKEGA